jgi:hypothetical protein
MLHRICPTCGLENIPERETCKRCYAQLSTPTAKYAGVKIETAPVKSNDRFAVLTPLLPIRRLVVHLPQSPAEVRDRLTGVFREEIVETSGTGWLSRTSTYHGSLVDSTVVVRGPYGNRQSAQVVQGTLDSEARGSLLRLRSRPTIGSIALFILPIGVWVGIVLSQTWGSWIALFPLFVSVLFYGLFVIGAKSEAIDIATMLARLVSMSQEDQPSAENVVSDEGGSQ